MKYIEMLIIVMHLTTNDAKRYRHISSESVENILYYKDCNHKQKSPEAPILRSPPQKQECKMNCVMCCGDQCVNSQQLALGRQTNMEQKPPQPELKPMERKKLKPQMPPIQPLPERRGLQFTRENIKSLIAKDEDIRKILKDLVRVTMQKVDLMQMIKTRRNLVKRNSEASEDNSVSDNDL